VIKKIAILAFLILVSIAIVLYFKFGHMLKKHEILPSPAVENGILKLIDTRVSSRNFTSREIDSQILSEIMWAAYGKNSHGTRTIPTSRNKQNLSVYAITKSGAFLYNGKNLIQITNDDLRPLFAMQDFVLTAPLTILYTGTDTENSPIHAGAALQNVGLFASERGMSAVVRMMFDKIAIHKALNLPADEILIVSQTIGWPE
jgi:nitroreductase